MPAGLTKLQSQTVRLNLVCEKLEQLDSTLSTLEQEIELKEEAWTEYTEALNSLRRVNGRNTFSLEVHQARGHIDLDRLRTGCANIKVTD